MTLTALITGASSGIGAEYARQLASRGDSLVLVARDRPALEALAEELRSAGSASVEVLPADLLQPDQLARAEARLSDPARPVDLLVNNAGFGLGLGFERNDIEAETAHLRIHIEVPMRLMHTALQGMLERRSGRIVNVASVAAFIPRGTYAASKQWLVGFSRWANIEYRGRGVTVTAVCPGFTHTNFHERMGLAPVQRGWMWLESPRVVAESLRAVDRGRALSIPSFRYRVLARLARLLPASLVAKIGAGGRI